MRLLMKAMEKDTTLEQAAAKAGMCRQTASKYLNAGKMPSDMQSMHTWRTRSDPFEAYWEEVRQMLVLAPELQAKTLFDWLCVQYPGAFSEGQLRTLQRRIRDWRALEGPPQEIFFPQVHEPGRNMALDFTSMNELEIRIAGEAYPHIFCHCVLTYSNWEWGVPCQSESLLALRYGLQESLFRLGHTPSWLWTDSSTAATHKPGAEPNVDDVPAGKRVFNQRYLDLLKHFGMKPRVITLGEPHENGDVESLNGAFKNRVRQYLLLRGNRDFESRDHYRAFLSSVLDAANRPRQSRFEEEVAVMPLLRASRLCEYDERRVRVTTWGTVRIGNNTYSVPSRLRDQIVETRMYSDTVEVYYKHQLQLRVERLLGRSQVRINYRHIIDSLVRKPGALRNYRYREELFPTPNFRLCYDMLCETCSERTADIEYVRILALAAKTMESSVDMLLARELANGRTPRFKGIEEALGQSTPATVPHLVIPTPDLKAYDMMIRRTSI
jgi:hypothetical protein